MEKTFKISPVGTVRKRDEGVIIEINPAYEDGLMGLDQNSHIIVFSWFHKSDTPEKRKRLQVHPRRNKANPLTGVFATRSPVRPNPISICACKILSIDGRRVHVDAIDAFDGTPVIDIKPYVPRLDAISEVRMPGWAKEQPRD
ncbi:MAG: tRNA (N6-threonylcarbamoyladenosine(37)-N6)-methyltransferase TrmO [Desulfobacteraceae bacterium]|jgi:tRNA-Thr(GGU) m(6)t(6)A37 methyltransferase TsaA